MTNKYTYVNLFEPLERNSQENIWNTPIKNSLKQNRKTGIEIHEFLKYLKNRGLMNDSQKNYYSMFVKDYLKQR